MHTSTDAPADRPGRDEPPVPERLLQAARTCFLRDDYHQVGTRRIAEMAGVNVSMIRYYFGSKEGLYEEMIRASLGPVLQALEGGIAPTAEGFAAYLRVYYRTMAASPEFARLLFKILALRDGPGRRFVQQLLERGRSRGGEGTRAALQAPDPAAGPATPAMDRLHLAFTSLAMMPILLKDAFEAQLERRMDDAFLDGLALFNGRLFAAGMGAAMAGDVPPATSGPEDEAPR